MAKTSLLSVLWVTSLVAAAIGCSGSSPFGLTSTGSNPDMTSPNPGGGGTGGGSGGSGGGGGSGTGGNGGGILGARAIASGDLDGDGDMDLAIANRDANTINILLNNGSGSFTPSANPLATPKGPEQILVADLDGNGTKDLAITSYGSELSIFLQDSSHSFSRQDVTGSIGAGHLIVAADLNNDGRIDIITAGSSTQSGSEALNIRLNKGGSSPFYSTQDLPILGQYGSIAAARFDVDSYVDLTFSHRRPPTYTSAIVVHSGNGTGTAFVDRGVVEVGASTASEIIALGDMNRDGKMDLVTTWANPDGSSEGFRVLLGDGAGNLSNAHSPIVIGQNARDLKLGDLDGKNGLDVIFVGAESAVVTTLLNNGSGGFSSPREFSAPEQSGFSAVADFNRDGRMDVAVPSGFGSAGESIYVYLTGSDGSLGAPILF